MEAVAMTLAAAPVVGVLLDRHILRRGVRGLRTFERLEYYVEAAKELEIDIVFFDLGGVRLKERKVAAFAPEGDGTFRRKIVPLPPVVHKRSLYRERSATSAARHLSRLGVHVFNPEVRWDKYRIDRMLRRDPELRRYLPDAASLSSNGYAWFRSRLLEGTEVFVKPRKGSLGLGIARVVPAGKGRFRVETAAGSRTTSLAGAWKRVRKGRRNHYLQAGIRLLEEDGRRIDLRVPVQRDGSGAWRVPGMAAKRAERHAFLTNVARGGSVHVPRELLERLLGRGAAAAVTAEIERMAVRVAEAIAARFPGMADLGLDVGIDRRGRPFLIEVNRRDLRITMGLSGQVDVHRALYRNPLAYACHLLRARA